VIAAEDAVRAWNDGVLRLGKSEEDGLWKCLLTQVDDGTVNEKALGANKSATKCKDRI